MKKETKAAVLLLMLCSALKVCSLVALCSYSLKQAGTAGNITE